MCTPRPDQSGNILFLILLAVVLFAALTYAVTSSMRGGGRNASAETPQLMAASITQYFDQIDAAVLRMTMSQGVKPETISFEYPFMNNNLYQTNPNGTGSAYFINSDCTSDACRIFKTDGGNVTPRHFNKYGVDGYSGSNGLGPAPGYYTFELIQWPYAGTSAPDVVLSLVGIDPAICPALKAALSLGNEPGFSGAGLNAHSAGSTWDSSTKIISSNINDVIGRSTLVTTKSTAPAWCNVFHVVLSR